MSTLVVRTGRARGVSEASFSGMSRAIEGPELEVNVLEADAIVLGAFQRPCEVETDLPIVLRASGGGALRVGPGTVHAILALPEPSTLAVDADTTRILNRYVRPLLKAVTAKASIITSYFGRDWISTAHRPVGVVGFAHDSITRRTVFEAFVATRTPFAIGERATFQGKEPSTLDAMAGKPVDPVELAASIVATYAAAWVLDVEERAADDEPALPSSIEKPWLAHVDEAIGPVRADRESVGGEFMASADAVARLNAELALLRTGADDASAVASAVDRLAAPGVALEGIRSLHSFKNAVLQARAAGA